jgi:hypothetical protein
MAPERRNQIVLAALVLVLVGALYRAVDQTAQVPGVAARRTTGGPARAGGAASKPVEAPDVRLEALGAERPQPGAGERNLFEFGSRRAAPVTEPVDRAPRLPPTPTQGAVQGAPSLPPIALTFIGVVEATEKSETYAVLRDDRGVYHGREGDIVEGRYRILRIGAESIELAYVDGRGRQTIRLGS